jgi:hypothetical protein
VVGRDVLSLTSERKLMDWSLLPKAAPLEHAGRAVTLIGVVLPFLLIGHSKFAAFEVEARTATACLVVTTCRRVMPVDSAGLQSAKLRAAFFVTACSGQPGSREIESVKSVARHNSDREDGRGVGKGGGHGRSLPLFLAVES